MFSTYGWMAFPQKLHFAFKHFATVILTGVANAFYAQMIHMINCSEVFTKSSAFQKSILIYSVQIHVCRQVPPKHEMYCYSFTGWKSYLVIQTWRMVKMFRYPCQDVGCYPWHGNVNTTKGICVLHVSRPYLGSPTMGRKSHHSRYLLHVSS